MAHLTSVAGTLRTMAGRTLDTISSFDWMVPLRLVGHLMLLVLMSVAIIPVLLGCAWLAVWMLMGGLLTRSLKSNGIHSLQHFISSAATPLLRVYRATGIFLGLLKIALASMFQRGSSGTASSRDEHEDFPIG